MFAYSHNKMLGKGVKEMYNFFKLSSFGLEGKKGRPSPWHMYIRCYE